MNKAQSYSIIQFFPDTSRNEGINLGVLLFEQDSNRIYTRIKTDLSRLAKSSDEASLSFLKIAAEEFELRIKKEFLKNPAIETLQRFQSMRANNFRLTSVMPTFALNASVEVDRLFESLVGEDQKSERKQKVSAQLKSGLKSLNALSIFDNNPEPVNIPRYNIKLRPDLGQRRDVYNLIEAARFDDSEIGLEQAGKFSLAGKALESSLGMRLIIVGQFGDQSDDYFKAIKEDLAKANTALYRMDQLDVFARDFAMH